MRSCHQRLVWTTTGTKLALLSMALAIFLVLYPVPAAAQIVLRVATWDGPEGQIPIRDVIAEFEAENPGVQVQLEQVDDYKARIIVQIAGGVGPDVYMVGDWDYAEFAQGGLAANLTPYLERDGVDLGMYIPQLLENHRYIDGNIYTLPKDFSTLGVYYNKDLFDQAGIAYPQPGWTWEEALEMMRKLTRARGDGEVETWGVVVNPWWNAIAWAQAWGRGRTILSPDFRTARGYLDHPDTVSALQFFYDLGLVYGVNTPDAVRDASGGERGVFLNGQAAILIWGNWAIGELQRDGPFRFGTVTPPTFGENATTFLMEAGWAMNPNIEDPERRELAWKLLKKLGTERGQYYMSRNFWAMPSIPAVADEIGMIDDEYYRPFFEAAFQTMPTYWTKIPFFGDVFDRHYNEIRAAYLQGQQDLAVAISQNIAAIERSLQQAFSEE